MEKSKCNRDFQKGAKLNPANYKPVIGKMMERIIKEDLVLFACF